MTTTPLNKILDALEWRGPTGRAMGHVILKRAEAQELLTNLGIKLNQQQSEVHNIEVVVTREERLRTIQAIAEEHPPTARDIEP